MRCVRLIQQDGWFAEHGARLRHLSDLDVLLDDHDRALPEDQQPAGPLVLQERVRAGLRRANGLGGPPIPAELEKRICSEGARPNRRRAQNCAAVWG